MDVRTPSRRRHSESRMNQLRASALLHFFVVLTLCQACGSSVRATRLSPDLQLRAYSPLAVGLVSSSGALSFSGIATHGIVAANASSGEAQLQLALQSMRFELRAIGFEVLDDTNSAKAIGEFSIGAVRYDPIGGWIADQAFLRIRAKSSGQTVAAYRADGRFITPSVANLVSNVAKAIAKDW